MSRVQKSGIVAIVILAAGILISSRLAIDLSRRWTRLQPPPAQVGRWRSKKDRFPQAVYDALPGAEVWLREYQDPVGAAPPLSLTIISSPFLNNFHNPDYCYKAVGYDEASHETLKITSSGGGLTANGALVVMKNQDGRQLLLYGWYVLGKRRYASVRDLKWQMSKERFFKPSGVPAYFVSVVTPMLGDKERAERSIERFVQDLLPYVRYEYAYALYIEKQGEEAHRQERR
jgi:hypothetical protein